MLPVLVVFALVSGVSFLFYGFEILFTARGRDEFERYGMPGVRRLVGSAQLLGGAGVLLGLGYAPLGAAAAAGLAVMMLLGLIVRLRIHDGPRLMVPAASLGAVNALLTGLFLIR
ncbi:MAG: DoxX family protein [Acidimicrobiales bacterium]